MNFCKIICWTQSLTFCLKISSRCRLNDKTISQVHATETVSLSFKCEIHLKCEISWQNYCCHYFHHTTFTIHYFFTLSLQFRLKTHLFHKQKNHFHHRLLYTTDFDIFFCISRTNQFYFFSSFSSLSACGRLSTILFGLWDMIRHTRDCLGCKTYLLTYLLT